MDSKSGRAVARIAPGTAKTAAGGDIISDITPPAIADKGKIFVYHVVVAFSADSILYERIGSQSIALNNGDALVAARSYAFTIPRDPADGVLNFRISADVTVRKFNVIEQAL